MLVCKKFQIDQDQNEIRQGLTVEEHAKTQEALQERLHSLNIDPIGIFKDVLDDKLSTYFRNKIDDLIEKSLTKKVIHIFLKEHILK